MGATDQLFVTNQKVLASGIPSTHGTNRTSLLGAPPQKFAGHERATARNVPLQSSGETDGKF
jgi:hypothetical protein